jgi:hypothetical protein
MQRYSRCFAEPGPYQTPLSLPGLTRQSILFKKASCEDGMDARVKPAHDEGYRS